VTILGILAAIVVPQVSSGADEARHAQFVQSLRSIVTACELATEINGYNVEDAKCGELPVELQPYFPASTWAKATPLGGLWDTEQDLQGVTSAVGAHFHGGLAPPDSEMLVVDAMFDDGSLTSGAFRKLGSDRFYFVLEE
jgi:type II secretory pathway pseudopilin PulG